jgi:O-antigen/teichoic acid export membrane protein
MRKLLALRESKLVRSGVFYTIALFVVGLGNFAFQPLIGRHLEKADFGLVNVTLPLITFLSLAPQALGQAIAHYVSHFHASGDDARLQGLIAGCRRALFHLTLYGSLMAAALVVPLSAFFKYPSGIMVVTMICVIAGFWTTFASALCSGLGWFGRMALILLGGMILRLAFGAVMLLKFQSADIGVLATGFSMLSYLALLHWRKELTSEAKPVSPWNREFAGYVAVAAAFIYGNYFFTMGDLLVTQRYFSKTEVGDYSAAHMLAMSLPIVVNPLLSVLFTSRSAHRHASILREQLTLLGLSAVGLAVGVVGLLLLKELGVWVIFGGKDSATASMIGPLALTMAFVGLLQALGTWALASRWLKMSLAYGALGLAFWLTLLLWAKTPALMLRIMPIASGIAFTLMLICWLFTLKASTRKEAIPPQS